MPLRAYAAIAVTLAVGACDQAGDRIEITGARGEAPAAQLEPVSDEERFRLPVPRDPAQNPFTWETPEGWRQMPEDQFRVINYTFGPEGEGECYLTVLPGGGDLAGNLDRWRGQMGLPPMTEDDMGEIGFRELFGGEAYYVDFAGTFSGRGAEPQEDYRLVGVLQDLTQFTATVKMTGPTELVEANLTAFDEFCRSIQFKR